MQPYDAHPRIAGLEQEVLRLKEEVSILREVLIGSNEVTRKVILAQNQHTLILKDISGILEGMARRIGHYRPSLN